MIVFNPSKTGPLRFVPSFERAVGGAELNFAIGITRLDMEARWISCIGDDEFGKVIYNFARGEGVDVSHVSRTPNIPTSIYFKEIGEDGAGKSFYYRKPSPLLELTADCLDESVLDGVDLLHISGVYLAVCEHNIEVALKLVHFAKVKNIPVSFDPNLRLKLWTIEDARAAYEKLYSSVNLLLTGQDEFELLFEGRTVKGVQQQYQIDEIIIKKGEQGASVYTATEQYDRAAFSIRAIDTVGAGDAFDAAYVYGYLNGDDIPERLRLANGAGALVATIKGDNEGLPSLQELKQFIGDEKLIER
ncbi:2-keto-3-deoxygluconate kinase [Lysinibacillus macroides]|uniref:2-keto-3-deoxygluconate kinase n=2 Tax=Bacillaceae TaxID=186817 RepID=A0A0M9DHI1_9BACI|nr:2-keto-3-deoxygluconate kinase [Lysinibacillus macroides]